MVTQIAVQFRGGRHRVRLVSGLLRPQLLRSNGNGCRIGLLAGTALLLGGDEVELMVSVGPGATLDLFDVAATVAYHGRGRSASWHLTMDAAAGATVRYAGEPLIVSDGAAVRRSTQLDVSAGARVVLRETVVLGRAGEVGGRLRSQTHVRVGGRDVWLEDQLLDVEQGRCLPGMLGECRVLDTVLRLGDGAGRTNAAGAAQFSLLEGAGTVTRFLGSSLAASPLRLGLAGPGSAITREMRPAAAVQ